MTSHHLHPNPDVDDMLRAANARAEAAEAERDRLAEKAEWWERTCVYWNGQAQAALRFRDAAAATAEAAERRLAEQQAAVLALADEWEQTPTSVKCYALDRAHGSRLRAALSDPTALDALIARERAAALREFADWWDDPANTDELRRLADEHYRAAGPSMPSIVARLRADALTAEGGER